MTVLGRLIPGERSHRVLWSQRTGTMPYQPAERAAHTDCPHGPEAAGCIPAHWIPVPFPSLAL